MGVESDWCKIQWQYSIPSFAFKGRATPSMVRHVNSYLLDEDCMVLMKIVWYISRDFEKIVRS